MTHKGILKINEFFNRKLKDIDKIKVSITYIGNFGNLELFKNLRRVVRRLGYEDVEGQIDTLYCIIDSIKSGDINDAIVTAALSGTNRNYLPTKDVIDAFKNILSTGKIAFDDRIRRDNIMAFYLTETNFCIKTNFYTLDQQRELYKKLIRLLTEVGLFIPKKIEYKINSADLYHQVYDNSKSVITNMSSRGISLFAIACYFWLKNKKLISKPFMQAWSNVNFIQALMTTPIYKNEANDAIKNEIKPSKLYWTVLSEHSLMTGKVANVEVRRELFNVIINKVLNQEGEDYIRDYLRQLKLVGSGTPIQTKTLLVEKDAFKIIEESLKNELEERTTKVPTKEEIVAAIKYQFMISRVLDVDFSSKRKDHIIFDKATRKRVFEIL